MFLWIITSTLDVEFGGGARRAEGVGSAIFLLADQPPVVMAPEYVDPAKPARTLSLNSRLILRAEPFRTSWPNVTWPSLAMTTLLFLRTHSTVVDRMPAPVRACFFMKIYMSILTARGAGHRFCGLRTAPKSQHYTTAQPRAAGGRTCAT